MARQICLTLLFLQFSAIKTGIFTQMLLNQSTEIDYKLSYKLPVAIRDGQMHAMWPCNEH